MLHLTRCLSQSFMEHLKLRNLDLSANPTNSEFDPQEFSSYPRDLDIFEHSSFSQIHCSFSATFQRQAESSV